MNVDMKNKLFVFFFIFLLILISCKKNSNDDGAKYHVVINGSPKDNDIISITEFVDSVDFIKLETTNSCLIGRISKIIFTNNLLIIQDAKTASIFLFDRNGKFINSISNRGNGPGEYVSLTRVMFDSVSQQIIIYDSSSSKMIFYNTRGDFIKEINQFCESAVIRDIINLPNKNFLCYCHDYSEGYKHCGLWEVDSTGLFLKTYLNRMHGYPFLLNEDNSYLYLISDGIGLCCGDVDKIFHYRQDSLYEFLSYKIKNGTSIEDIKNNKDNKAYTFVDKIKTQEKRNLLLTEWIDEKNTGFKSIYSTIDNKITVGRGINYNNTHFASVWGHIVDSNDTTSIVLYIPADLVIEGLNNQYTTEIARNKLKELTSEMSESDISEMNPIIEILHVK